MAERQPFTQVDAFTDQPFAGNPAAVFVLPSARDAAWMGRVANELNLADSAYLVRREDGYDLRWFTPAAEVDLCGHATLASAHVLWQDGHLAAGAVARFHTRSGVLTAERRDGLIWLDFPASVLTPTPAPAGLERILGATPHSVWQTAFDLLVELDDEAAVRVLDPDLSAIAKLRARGVIVTAASSSGGCDFVSRFFAPGIGIPEDPVTGSAHCALAPFWAERFGRTELRGRQVSARGGLVRVRHAEDRVHLGGAAVTVARGEMLW
jgi:PhzF family phenazine biosynthesis protein